MSTPNPFSIFTEKTGNRGNRGTAPLKPARTIASNGSPLETTWFPLPTTGEPPCSERGTNKTQAEQRPGKLSSPVPRFPAKIDEDELAEREAIMIEDGGLAQARARALAIITLAPCPLHDEAAWRGAIDDLLRNEPQESERP